MDLVRRLGDGDALIVLPGGDTLEIRTPAGIYCSSTRAVMIALRDALSKVAESEDTGPTEESPIIACLGLPGGARDTGE